jgi:hypothetical protein
VNDDDITQWPTGETFADLVARVRAYSEANGTPATEVLQSTCDGCGGTALHLHVDDDEGVAGRLCDRCGTTAFLADSDEYWDEAEPAGAACPCGHEEFEVAVGFSRHDDGEIRWVTVGGRCLRCGIVGVYADWKIDYSPTGHLLEAV